MTVSKQLLAKERELGAAARRAGKPIEACPDRGSGRDAADREDAWRDGWHSENKGQGRTKR